MNRSELLNFKNGNTISSGALGGMGTAGITSGMIGGLGGAGGTTLLGANITGGPSNFGGMLGGAGAGVGAGGLHMQNSNVVGDSELDIEFGYCSEEESIF